MRFAALLLAVCTTCPALDIRLENGSSYTNIRLREKTPMGIRVQHDTGLSFFDYLSMKEVDRITFGYEEGPYNAAKAKLGLQATATPVPIPAPVLPRSTPVPVPTPTTTRGFAPKYVAPAATPEPTRTTVTSSYSGRCSATTKKGYRCSRSAESGRAYCWQHP